MLRSGALALSEAAEASERASPTTSWPLLSNSPATAEPIHPVAPVMNTCVALFLWWLGEGDDDLFG